MAYMLAERIATAVVAGYRDAPDVDAQLASAEAFREWLEGLSIDATVRAGLVEPIDAVEHGLREVLRRRARDGAAAG
jgi:hypothetical protein